jgi:hypothetical protein
VFSALNAPRQRRHEQELERLAPLPAFRFADYELLTVRVRSTSAHIQPAGLSHSPVLAWVAGRSLGPRYRKRQQKRRQNRRSSPLPMASSKPPRRSPRRRRPAITPEHQGLEAVPQDGIYWPLLEATWSGRSAEDLAAAHHRAAQLLAEGAAAIEHDQHGA